MCTSHFIFFYKSPSSLSTPLNFFQVPAMKKLIRRLSRVSDSSQYCLLRSHSRSPRRSAKLRRLLAPSASAVPQGHLPVYVGDQMERFIVSADFLNHPVFINLLNKSAQEYGYEQQGVLRIPCHVLIFERVLEALRLGHHSLDLQHLLESEEHCP